MLVDSIRRLRGRVETYRAQHNRHAAHYLVSSRHENEREAQDIKALHSRRIAGLNSRLKHQRSSANTLQVSATHGSTTAGHKRPKTVKPETSSPVGQADSVTDHKPDCVDGITAAIVQPKNYHQAAQALPPTLQKPTETSEPGYLPNIFDIDEPFDIESLMNMIDTFPNEAPSLFDTESLASGAGKVSRLVGAYQPNQFGSIPQAGTPMANVPSTPAYPPSCSFRQTEAVQPEQNVLGQPRFAQSAYRPADYSAMYQPQLQAQMQPHAPVQSTFSNNKPTSSYHAEAVFSSNPAYQARVGAAAFTSTYQAAAYNARQAQLSQAWMHSAATNSNANWNTDPRCVAYANQQLQMQQQLKANAPHYVGQPASREYAPNALRCVGYPPTSNPSRFDYPIVSTAATPTLPASACLGYRTESEVKAYYRGGPPTSR